MESNSRSRIVLALVVACVLVFVLLGFLVMRALTAPPEVALRPTLPPVPSAAAATLRVPEGTATFPPPTAPAQSPAPPTVTATLVPSDTAVIYAGGGDRVFVSRDGGASWISRTFTSTVQAVAAVTNTLGLVGYAATRNADGSELLLWKTTDGGSTFDVVSNLPRARGYFTQAEFSLIAVDPVSPTQVYVGLKGTVPTGAKGALLRSTDNFASDLLDQCHRTGPRNPLQDCVVTSLAIDPRNPNRLWIGQVGSAVVTQTVMLSNDGGRTWASRLSANVNFTSVSLHAGNPEVVWALTMDGWSGGIAYRSENAGAAWKSIPLKSPQNSLDHVIVADPFDPATAWASGGLLDPFTGKGLQVTRNGNGAWTPVATQFRALTCYAPRLLFGVPLAPLNEAAVLRSLDGGVTWTATGVKAMTDALKNASAPLSVVRFGSPPPD